jgi:hypothetical protein
MNYTDTPITGKPWPIDRRTHPGMAVKSETRAACCMLWVTIAIVQFCFSTRLLQNESRLVSRMRCSISASSPFLIRRN